MLLTEHLRVEGLTAGLFRPVVELASCLRQGHNFRSDLHEVRAFLLRLYEFDCGKLTPGTSSLKSWASQAGLKQRVVGRGKDMTARGYSVATS